MGTPQIPSVDSDSKQFPNQVRARVAANFVEPGMTEYQAISAGWQVLRPTGADDKDSIAAALQTGNVFLVGDFKTSSKIPHRYWRTLSANGATITWIGEDVVTPIIDCGAGTYQTVEGIDFFGISNQQVAVDIQGGHHLKVRNNRMTNCRVASSNATGGVTAYANIGPTDRAHHIEVDGNVGIGSDKNVGGSGVTINYSDDWSITRNSLENYRHGVNWWGGDSNFAKDGDLANERKCARGLTAGNTVRNMALGGIWGSMGTELSIGPDRVSNCGDVGVDLEGCSASTVYVGVVSNCTNGNLATFFGCDGVTFTGGTSIQSGTSPHFIIQNSSLDPAKNPSVSFSDVQFITTSGIGVAGNNGGPAQSVIVQDCKFRNTRLQLAAQNLVYVTVAHNNFVFTAASSAAFNAITVGAVTRSGAKNVVDNIVHSSVAQPAGSRSVYSTDGDFNSSPLLRCERNQLSSQFPIGVAAVWSGTNAGTKLTAFVRDNIAPTASVSSAGAGAAAVIVSRDNFTRAGAAVTVATT